MNIGFDGRIHNPSPQTVRDPIAQSHGMAGIEARARGAKALGQAGENFGNAMVQLGQQTVAIARNEMENDLQIDMMNAQASYAKQNEDLMNKLNAGQFNSRREFDEAYSVSEKQIRDSVFSKDVFRNSMVWNKQIEKARLSATAASGLRAEALWQKKDAQMRQFRINSAIDTAIEINNPQMAIDAIDRNSNWSDEQRSFEKGKVIAQCGTNAALTAFKEASESALPTAVVKQMNLALANGDEETYSRLVSESRAVLNSGFSEAMKGIDALVFPEGTNPELEARYRDKAKQALSDFYARSTKEVNITSSSVKKKATDNALKDVSKSLLTGSVPTNATAIDFVDAYNSMKSDPVPEANLTEFVKFGTQTGEVSYADLTVDSYLHAFYSLDEKGDAYLSDTKSLLENASRVLPAEAFIRFKKEVGHQITRPGERISMEIAKNEAEAVATRIYDVKTYNEAWKKMNSTERSLYNAFQKNVTESSSPDVLRNLAVAFENKMREIKTRKDTTRGYVEYLNRLHARGSLATRNQEVVDRIDRTKAHESTLKRTYVPSSPASVVKNEALSEAQNALIGNKQAEAVDKFKKEYYEKHGKMPSANQVSEASERVRNNRTQFYIGFNKYHNTRNEAKRLGVYKDGMDHQQMKNAVEEKNEAEANVNASRVNAERAKNKQKLFAEAERLGVDVFDYSKEGRAFGFKILPQKYEHRPLKDIEADIAKARAKELADKAEYERLSKKREGL